MIRELQINESSEAIFLFFFFFFSLNCKLWDLTCKVIFCVWVQIHSFQSFFSNVTNLCDFALQRKHLFYHKEQIFVLSTSVVPIVAKHRKLIVYMSATIDCNFVTFDCTGSHVVKNVAPIVW